MELTKASNADSLSRLYNRRFLHCEFITLIECSYPANKRLSLIMIDLDKVKKINDYFGYLDGGKLVICMAEYYS